MICLRRSVICSTSRISCCATSGGTEKSVFKFGGSAVVVFGERGAWRPSDDILKYTKENIETRVRLGEPIAEWLGESDTEPEATPARR